MARTRLCRITQVLRVLSAIAPVPVATVPPYRTKSAEFKAELIETASKQLCLSTATLSAQRKVAAMGLTSTLTLRASGRGWLGGGGCFLDPSAMAGAERALWWEQRWHLTLKWALLSFL